MYRIRNTPSIYHMNMCTGGMGEWEMSQADSHTSNNIIRKYLAN